MNTKLNIQLSAGYIKRYHNHHIIGEQIVASHTYGVLQILRFITEDNCSKNLWIRALDHDVMEHFIGDMPYSVKKMFPQLGSVLSKTEKVLREQYGFVETITEEEEVVLKAADLLEMGSFGTYQMQLGNHFGRVVVEKVVEELKELPSNHLPQKAKELIIDLEESIDASK